MEPLDRTSGFPAAAAERVTAFLRAVYGWMCVGLGVTAFVAYAIVVDHLWPYLQPLLSR